MLRESKHIQFPSQDFCKMMKLYLVRVTGILSQNSLRSITELSVISELKNQKLDLGLWEEDKMSESGHL